IREHALGAATTLVIGIAIVAAILWVSRSSSSSVPRGAGAAHRQVTFSGNAYEASISPDGMSIAFVARKQGEPQRLIVQAPNGSTLELAHGEELLDELSKPHWSPDGSELVFVRLEPSRSLSRVFLVSRVGGVARLIADGSSACWSPDGSQIMTIRESSNQVTLVDRLTGNAKRISIPAVTFVYGID